MNAPSALKGWLKRQASVVVAYQAVKALQQFGMSFSWLAGLGALWRYSREYRDYVRRNDNPRFTMRAQDIYPCLRDRTELTPVEPTYFFQDSWMAGKVFRARPSHHYDIGSSANTIGILSQFVPTTMVDIRPIDLQLPDLRFRDGSLLALPFEDASIVSLSSICVIEHVGLGRFGDEADPWGSEKSARELIRVLARGGNLYVSVPVDDRDRVYFNAHRAFTRASVLELFAGLELVEEKYHYGRAMYDVYDPARGFGTGMYHFAKRP